MKKIFILFSLNLLLGFSLSAQVQRLVLAEEFTQASCGPCAAQNPAFDALLNANTDKITSVKYHTSWPGVDPMNAHNTTDVAQRVTYYSVTGVPYCRMDGVATNGSSYSGAPSNLTQTMINNEFGNTSPIEIQVQHILSPNLDSIFVNTMIYASQAVSGQLVAHIVELEKSIHFASAPGSNGETNFNNVVVKLLPSKTGTALPASMNAGDYVLIRTSWALPAWIYSKNQLAATVFVQNNTDKSVLQAGRSTANAIIPHYQTDAAVTAVTNIPVNMCSTTLSPVVRIQNNGVNPLTAVDIVYHVNSGANATFHWTGNLGTFESTMVTLPDISFILNASNIVYTELQSPNGIADDYTANNTLNVAFAQAPTAALSLHLILKTDNFPQQTTWSIKESNGTLISSGGPYAQASTVTQLNIPYPGAGCYLFEILDAGNNGLCCTNGYGYYQLTDANGQILAEGDQFGSQKIHSFSFDVIGINQPENQQSVTVYPNPFTNMLHFTVELGKPASCLFEIYNETGSKVLEHSVNDLTTGKNEVSIDGSGLASGLYLVKVHAGDQVITLKVSK